MRPASGTLIADDSGEYVAVWDVTVGKRGGSVQYAEVRRSGEERGLEGLLDLAERIGEEGRRLRGALPLGTLHQASDVSGSIRVSVDIDSRVRDVEIVPNWWRSVDPEYFGEALIEAYAAAAAQIVIGIVTSLENSEVISRDRDWSLGSDQGDGYQRQSSERELAAYENEADNSVTVFGRGRMLSATVRANRVVAIQVCRRSLPSVPIHRLSEEALSVFAASERVAEGGVDAH